MTTPEYRDDVPAADAAEQDVPADPDAVDTGLDPDGIPADADAADVLEQRADATPEEDE